MAPVLLALYFSVMLHFAFGDLNKGVRFEFRTSRGLFNHQRFKAKTLTRPSIIRDLLFADDAALVATSVQEAQELIDRFSLACKAFGLSISIKKTEAVHQPKPTSKQVKGVRQQQSTHRFPDVPIKIDGQQLKYVKSFKYLGSTINYSASLEDEIINHISKATEAFGKLRHCLWNARGISLKTKISVYRAVVLTTLLYGSESWTPYRTQINKLDVFHKHCLRTICSYTLEVRVTNADLFDKCNIDGIEFFLMKAQLRWVGHVILMSDERTPKRLMYGQILNGARNVGRPLLRFKDKLKYNLKSANIAISTFEALATNRSEWKVACYKGIKGFVNSRIAAHLRELRARAKSRSTNQPADTTTNAATCSICGLVCKSLASLRHKHKD